MRIPLTKYAVREILLFAGAGMILTLAVLLLAQQLWYLAAVPALATIWVFSFFRDPERRAPEGGRLILAPADGRVTHVELIDAPEELGAGGRARRISIFLSVFDCHLNRAPFACRVEKVVYRRGRFLNALRATSARENEQSLLVVQAEAVSRPALVRQVAGVIARRIVCDVRQGDHLAAGQTFGMIKFGSRTDLLLPADVPLELSVKVGDHVRAGLTVLGRFV